MASRVPVRVRWSWFLGWVDSAPLRRRAPDADRCFMGAPVGPRQHCRRPAVGDTLWCQHHTAKEGF